MSSGRVIYYSITRERSLLAKSGFRYRYYYTVFGQPPRSGVSDTELEAQDIVIAADRGTTP